MQTFCWKTTTIKKNLPELYQRKFSNTIQSCSLGIVWEGNLFICTTTSINKVCCSYMKNVAVGKEGCYHPSTIVSFKFFWEKGGEKKREGLKKKKQTINCCSANWTEPLSRLSCHFQLHSVESWDIDQGLACESTGRKGACFLDPM